MVRFSFAAWLPGRNVSECWCERVCWWKKREGELVLVLREMGVLVYVLRGEGGEGGRCFGGC